MTDAVSKDWMTILQRLNALELHSDQARGEGAGKALAGRWRGKPPASESEILQAETRLGVKLPPSYREFLSVSNGWYPFNSFVERLLSVHEIDRYRVLEPEHFASSERAHERALGLYGDQAFSVSDDDYLDYATPAHNIAIRYQYYGDSLLISVSQESELVLLNPFVISADGEWETIFSAQWIPGNERFRSFRHYLEKCIRDEEEAEANHAS